MTILIVDDELDIKPLFEQRFRREIRSGSLTLVFANSGVSALDYLTQYGTENLIILSDINMPGMSGFDFLRQVRSAYALPPPPVILMITAYGDQQNYDQAMQHGANDFLTKPLDFTQLKAKLTQFNSL